jgi:hypothetical protein
MSFSNPASILVDYSGLPLFASQSQDLSGNLQSGVMVIGSGSDGKAYMFRASPEGSLFVTGTLNASFSPAPNTPVSQGMPGGIADSWNVKITDGFNVLGTGSSAPLHVTGSVSIVNTHTGSVVTLVSASTSVVTLSALNRSKKGVTLYYNGTKNLFMKLGAAATSTNFTAKLGSKSYYEVPFDYTGQITGIWDSDAGSDNYVLVTEIYS